MYDIMKTVVTQVCYHASKNLLNHVWGMYRSNRSNT